MTPRLRYLILLGLTLGGVLSLVVLGGCAHLPTTAQEELVQPPVPGQLSPKGYWLIDSSELGAEPRHAGTYADDRLAEVQRCVGIFYNPWAFHFKLKKAQGLGNGFWYGSHFVGGVYVLGQDRIEVLGDPVYATEWRHEMYHLLLDKSMGNPDERHLRPEWTRCGLRNN